MFNDFTPDYEFIGTSNLTPFEVWCQKILPTIYDNSLSYYELLNKVVKYLNDTMTNVNNLQKDMTELNKAYQQLVTYVNDFKNYTENELDKQNQEIVKLNNAWITFKAEVDNAIAQIPEQIETKMDEYTASPAFSSKVRAAVDQSLQESGTLPEITEINSKIGNQTGSETVFSELTEIKSKVTNINVSGVDTINEKIGSTGDSQGSATAGSVFAKLNLLIKAGAGSGSTDVNVQSIVDNIGATSDANGTETAGTVFGKLNKIIGIVNNYDTSYLYPISTTVNSMDEKMGNARDTEGRTTIFGKLAGLLSAINIFDNKVGTNTDAETGNTVFAKLNKIINKNDNIITNIGDTSQPAENSILGKLNKIETETNKIGNIGITGNNKPIITKFFTGSTEVGNVSYTGHGMATFEVGFGGQTTTTSTITIDGQTYSFDKIRPMHPTQVIFTFYFNSEFKQTFNDTGAVATSGFVQYQSNE